MKIIQEAFDKKLVKNKDRNLIKSKPEALEVSNTNENLARIDKSGYDLFVNKYDPSNIMEQG